MSSLKSYRIDWRHFDLYYQKHSPFLIYPFYPYINKGVLREFTKFKKIYIKFI